MFRKKRYTYEMEFPPTGIDYNSWNKRTADKYFKWYMEQIPFLFGSHVNQIKITDNATKKTYKTLSITTNAIGDLVTFAKKSGVTISHRTVKTGYSY